MALGRDGRALEMGMWDSKRTAVLPAAVAVNKDIWLSLLSKPGPKCPGARLERLLVDLLVRVSL